MTSKKRNKTLAGKLTLRIALALLLVFFIMISLITAFVREDLVKRELHTLELLAKENATIASNLMNTMLDKQEVLVASVQTLQMSDASVRGKVLANLIQDVGDSQDNILSLFFVAEPNAFIPDTPDGFSVFCTASGVKMQNARFTYVDQAGYQAALEAKALTVVDPFTKMIDGKEYQVLTLFQPVFDKNGGVLGLIGSNIDVAVLEQQAYNNGGYETFNNQIICGHETMILNSRDPSTVGKKFVDVTTSSNADLILKSAADTSAFTLLDADKNGGKSYRVFVPFYVGSSKTTWLSGTSINAAEFDQAIFTQLLMMAIIAVVALAVLALFCYTITKRMLRPLHGLETMANALSQGQLEVRAAYTGNDEIGRVSEKFQEACDTIHDYISDIDRAMGEMSRGNFDVKPKKPFIGDFANIEASITNFIYKICVALDQINETSGYVSAGSDQVSNASAVLSHGATEQAHSVEELTGTILLLAEKVQQNNENAKLAGTRVGEAGNQLEVCNARMQEMVGAINEITRNSAEIGKIIKTIEDIAFQTNILALNAAVEAARAGAAGKGFAVVADEVRNLAGKSAEAAKSTTDMIKNTIASVSDGSRIAQEAAASLTTVQAKAAAVVDIVGEIRTASDVQLEQVETVSISSRQISEVIQTNSATSEESAASSEELASQAQVLKELVSQFKLNTTLMNALSQQRPGSK